MNELSEPRQIDKTKWGPGPWQDEPDRIEWESKGMPCMMIRTHMGNWCGYVAVSPGHTFHGVKYSECAVGCKPEKKGRHPFSDVKLNDPHLKKLRDLYKKSKFLMNMWRKTKSFACTGHSPESQLNVHGGITYSDFCKGDICHVPKSGHPDNVYWFGFDCAHGGDVVPSMNQYVDKGITCMTSQSPFGETYKDAAYVRQEVEDLAKQLKAIA